MEWLGPHLLREARQKQASNEEVPLFTIEHAEPQILGVSRDESKVEDINAAANLVRTGFFLKARVALNKIKTEKWARLDNVEKYRVLANLGVVAVKLGETPVGVSLLLEAYDFNKTSEKARLLRAWALQLQGESSEAHEVVVALCDEFPSMADAAALRVQTTPMGDTLESVIGAIPAHLADEGRVARAVAERALDSGDWQKAEEVLRAALRRDENAPEVLQLLGVLLVSESNQQVADEGVEVAQGGRLREAAEFFEKALALLQEDGDIRKKGSLTLGLANARLSLCEEESANRHILESWDLPISDLDLRIRRVQLSLGVVDAPKLLQEIEGFGSEPPPHVHLIHALVLRWRNEKGDADLAVGTLRDKLILTDAPVHLREDGVDLATSCLTQVNRTDDAIDFLIGLADQPSMFLTRLLRAELCFSLAMHDEAKALAVESAKLLDDSVGTSWRQRLAKVLLESDCPTDAFDVLKARAISPWLAKADIVLINAAEAAGQYQFLQSYCDKLRKAGVVNAWLVDRELVALAKDSEFSRAIEVATEYLEARPDDKRIRLQRSRLALAIGNIEDVDAGAGDLVSSLDASAIVGLGTVQVLRATGQAERAREYAYELFRRHRNAPEAHHAVLVAMGPPFNSVPREPIVTAEFGTAVCLTEGSEQRWLILEDCVEPSVVDEEFGPEHPLSKNILGKERGDSVAIGQGRVAQRTAVISDIVHKHSHRHRDVQDNWERRFPDLPLVEMFDVPSDLNELSALFGPSLEAKEEKIRSLEKLYEEHPAMSLRKFCVRLGSTIVGGLGHLATTLACSVKCAYATQPEIEQFEIIARSASRLVISPSAVGTAILLDIDLASLSFELSVARSCLDELRLHAVELRNSAEASSRLMSHEGEVYMVKQDDVGWLQSADRVEQVILELEKSCTVFDALDRTVLGTSDWQILVESLGIAEAEGIIYAGETNAVLWTDDAVTGQFAHRRGVARVWTQLMLEQASELGTLEKEVLADLTAQLMGLGYKPTKLSPSSLVAAASRAKWEPDDWPLAQHLDILLPADRAPELAKIAAAMLKSIWHNAPTESMAQRVTIRIAQKLSDRSGSIRQVFGLLKLIDPVFYLDVVNADRAKTTIRGWLATQTQFSQ